MSNLMEWQRNFFYFLLREMTEDVPMIDTTEMLMALFLIMAEANDGGEPHHKIANIDRDRVAGHARLMREYFIEYPVYPAHVFRRRFRKRRSLFLRILADVTAANDYFIQKVDATGLRGLSNLQKVCSAIRMLAYDTAADELDEYLRLGESTTIRSLTEFCKTIISIYGPRYLRKPTAEDMERILQHSQSRGFPGMIGSLDCLHWCWKSCPRAWAGQFTGTRFNDSMRLIRWRHDRRR